MEFRHDNIVKNLEELQKEFTDDRMTLRCYDCPYTTQVIWKMLSYEDGLAYNKKIKHACNQAIFDTFLELGGLANEWIFNFPSQLCMTNQYCEFTTSPPKYIFRGISCTHSHT